MEKTRIGGCARSARVPSVFAWAASAWAALCAGFVAPARIAAAENHEVMVQRNVAAKMRDGATLRADIYRPKPEGKFPVLLLRTPYDKQWISSSGYTVAALGSV